MSNPLSTAVAEAEEAEAIVAPATAAAEEEARTCSDAYSGSLQGLILKHLRPHT